MALCIVVRVHTQQHKLNERRGNPTPSHASRCRSAGALLAAAQDSSRAAATDARRKEGALALAVQNVDDTQFARNNLFAGESLVPGWRAPGASLLSHSLCFKKCGCCSLALHFPAPIALR